MNWILVGLLAAPGLLMGLLSVRGHTRGIEPYLWIILGAFASLTIARTAGSKFFYHGLCIGLAWGVLNGLTTSALFSVYARHNPEITQRLNESADGPSPRVMFAASGPVIGLATGLVLGALCWAGTFVIKPASVIQPSGDAAVEARHAQA